MATTKKYEKRFEGPSNAGLRKQIREAVSGAWCGNENARLVLALGKTVALTETGRHTLAQVAEDYRLAGGHFKRTCDCDACYAGNLQLGGANG